MGGLNDGVILGRVALVPGEGGGDLIPKALPMARNLTSSDFSNIESTD